MNALKTYLFHIEIFKNHEQIYEKRNKTIGE